MWEVTTIGRPLLAAALAVALLPAPARADAVGDQRRREALAHYREGQAHMTDEQWEKAEPEFREAIRLDPLLAMAHYGLGQAYMALRRYPDAVKAFVGCREAYRELAALSQTSSDEAEIRREDEIRELKNSLARIQSGQIKYISAFTGMKIEERIRQLERTKFRDKQEVETPPEVAFSLGSAHLRAGSLADAEREFLEALKARPRFGEAHNNLAFVYMATGRLEEAAKELEQAERSGFIVNPRFKEDVKRARQSR